MELSRRLFGPIILKFFNHSLGVSDTMLKSVVSTLESLRLSKSVTCLATFNDRVVVLLLNIYTE